MAKIDHAPKQKSYNIQLATVGVIGASTLTLTLFPSDNINEPPTAEQRAAAVNTHGSAELHTEKSTVHRKLPKHVPNKNVNNMSSPNNNPSVPRPECWDGKISDLNHVPESRHKIALGNIALACEIAKDEKWFKKSPQRQMGCLVMLWDRESGWYQKSGNPKEAFGIPQSVPGKKMASKGADWQTNPATQISWGVGYIDGRYGTPCDALKHHDDHNWY